MRRSHEPDALLRHRRGRAARQRSARPRSPASRCCGPSRATADLFAFQTLVGLLLSNGPGTISSQGAKGAVSSDGPEQPERVQLNKAPDRLPDALRLRARRQRLRGRGLPARAVQGQRPRRPGRADARRRPQRAGGALRRDATRATRRDKKTSGSLDIQKIPGVNHPVFKDRPVNHDPREVFIARADEQRGEHNVFHDFYRALVQQLYDAGVSRNVYCVNIDAVIAALLLKMVWPALPRRHDRRRRAGDGGVHGLPVRRACSAAPPRSTTT